MAAELIGLAAPGLPGGAALRRVGATSVGIFPTTSSSTSLTLDLAAEELTAR
jgi:hypothetical protein